MTAKILFVCNGNIYRSMVAEYCLKKYLKLHHISNWQVKSAGVTAKKQKIHINTKQALAKIGINRIRHEQHKLTKKMLSDANIVIAMAEDQKKYIKEIFGFGSVKLFNQLAVNSNESIWDVKDNVRDYKKNEPAVANEIIKTINYIQKNTGKLYRRLVKLSL